MIRSFYFEPEELHSLRIGYWLPHIESFATLLSGTRLLPRQRLAEDKAG